MTRGGTTLDCAVLRDLYGTAEVRAALDSTALVQGWLDAERALAEAQAEAGLIPAWAAERIALQADAGLFDPDDLRKGIDESQHPLVPLIRALSERAGEAGHYVHWGATTQDIVDTGMALQIRAALAPIERDLGAAAELAAGLARRHAGDVMAGRTHGQHAVPITFGLKAASWADELERAGERLAAARRAVAVAQLGGAAGTLAAMGPAAADVRSRYAARLGLAEPKVPWHVARDRLRDLAHALDQVGGAAERVAAEVVRLQATEIGEVREPSAPGHVGSSTMPQKRNPMQSEYIIASARLLHAAAAALEGAPAHAGERDMGLWAVEWIAVPQALILSSSVVSKLAAVLGGLEVDTERMRENLGLTNGAIMAEAVMMHLAETLGHERAHRIVADAAARAAASGEPFESVLQQEGVLPQPIESAVLRRLFDPDSYLGLAQNGH